MEQLMELIISSVEHFGVIGIIMAMMLEGIIIIIPSELVLATGGILAARGSMTLLTATVAGIIGSVLCAIVIYAIGYFGGRPFVEKYGRFFFMGKEDVEKADKWFEKYGLVAALTGRCLPIIRTFISLPIGFSKVNFKKFVLFTFIGSIPWSFAFTYAGYKLGQNWTELSKYIDLLIYPTIIILAIPIVKFIYKKIKITYFNKK
jgi:membrane protein DedA with SNARE-associated domain